MVDWSCRLLALFVFSIPQLLEAADDLRLPIVGKDVVFEERDGLVVFEAEHFFEQTLTEKRAWYRTTRKELPQVEPDGDESHIAGASGGAYLEVLPDTRRSHGDPLVPGENFSNEPGKLAVLSYQVKFNTPGVYHLWARAFTTTTEDNGLHFGLNGEWPETAQRWQTVTKNRWHWESRQRTEAVHVGVPEILTLNIQQPGVRTVQISMREDGLALDRLLLVNQKAYRPKGMGPDVVVSAGELPPKFAMVAAAPTSDPPSPSAPASEVRPDVAAKPPLSLPRQADGNGEVTVSGELQQWHKVTFDLNGLYAHEQDRSPNPFTDYRYTVHVVHESGTPDYEVHGYFAADGKAASTGAMAGTTWRAHLSPDKPGRWTYTIAFTHGPLAALDGGGKPVAPYHGKTGEFTVAASDKSDRDFRAQGRLRYVGKHHLQFAGSQTYFLKAGPDAPETLLGYLDFDGTEPGQKRNARTGEASPNQVLHRYEPHLQDWKNGDPTWGNGRGKGLIGALNYISAQGMNVVSFLPYNAGGDGDNVWPFVERTSKLHYDCSKLDQWGIVFDHATTRGLYLHFKLQEHEIDDNRGGHAASEKSNSYALDGGHLGPERKLYCRELVARFGHALALNWNIGEENTQSAQQQRDMIDYLRKVDPYDHPIVIHTFPDWQDRVYTPLLGDKGSQLSGASLQNGWNQSHQRTVHWITASRAAGRPWVVANDEQGPADLGVPPDPGYHGHDGIARSEKSREGYTLHDVRRSTLWGNLMAGGAGVEYYFGYQLPQNDLLCEDWRSREQSWRYCRIALEFFHRQQIPFWDMQCADELLGNPKHDNSRYCLNQPGKLYLAYLATGGSGELDLTAAQGSFSVHWFNPRDGGELQQSDVKEVQAGGKVPLGTPPQDPEEDWLVVIRKRP